MSASNFGSPRRACVVCGYRRGWPSGQRAGADLNRRREMPFRRSATPTALSHVPPSQALGHGTNDVMAANRLPGGGFGLWRARGEVSSHPVERPRLQRPGRSWRGSTASGQPPVSLSAPRFRTFQACRMDLPAASVAG
jgi:hypothetical protein